MNTEQVLNITKNDKGHMYTIAGRRKQYVNYLKDHEHDSQMTRDNQIKVLKWTKKKMARLDVNH